MDWEKAYAAYASTLYGGGAGAQLPFGLPKILGSGPDADADMLREALSAFSASGGALFRHLACEQGWSTPVDGLQCYPRWWRRLTRCIWCGHCSN